MEIDETGFVPIYDIELSILIATMSSRNESFTALCKSLHSQIYRKTNSDVIIYKPVEIISDMSMDYNIGTKRNKLLQMASGKYVVFIDDDDLISNNYVSLILEAIQSEPDCIGINGTITTNGHNERQWFISKEYGHWHTGANGIYYRTPNHISPVRRELALQAGFPEISFGEDAEYSRRLLPLFNSEIIITEPLYKYLYVENK